MYSRNPEQAQRKQDYLRFGKLTKYGYSVPDDIASPALYSINTDPFGRAYYTKPLGESVKRDPFTGRKYTQQEWATKEFIIDNKAQLIVKASADMVVGKDITIEFNEENVPKDITEWLEDFLKKTKLKVKLYEGGMQNSAKGDLYFEVFINKKGEVDLIKRDPFFIDIETTDGNIDFYEIAFEFDIETPSKFLMFQKKPKTNTYVQKKYHYPGKILYSLYEKNEDEYTPVPLRVNPENLELIDRALKSKHMITYQSLNPEVETSVGEDVYYIVEYTGIDVPLIVHWPNYRMFDVFGVSDVGMIESLQNTLNNRETQLNDILDKHSDPSMYGPDAYLDEYGNLEMSQGGGVYFPVQAGSEKPGYLTWDGHIADSLHVIKETYKAILDNTEIASALLGDDTGGIQSGRALMYKLIRSLAMASRKQIYMKEAVREIIDIAQKLRQVWVAGPGVENTNNDVYDFETYEIVMDVKSSLPTDRTSIIEDVSRMIDKNILSQETAVYIVAKLFDEIVADEEIKKLLDAANAAHDKQKDLIKSETPDYLKSEPKDEDDFDDNKNDKDKIET